MSKFKQQKKLSLRPYEAALISVPIQAWVAPSSHTNMDPEQGLVSSAKPTKLCLCYLEAGQLGRAATQPSMRAAHSAADISTAVYMPLRHEDAAALTLARIQMRIMCVHLTGSFSCLYVHSDDHRVYYWWLYAYLSLFICSHPNWFALLTVTMKCVWGIIACLHFMLCAFECGVCSYESIFMCMHVTCVCFTVFLCMCIHISLVWLGHRRLLLFACLCYPPLGWDLDLQHSRND